MIKKDMKTAAALLFTIALSTSLIGCSASSDTPAASGEPDAGDSVTIGFINGANNEWGTCLQKGVEDEASAEGVDLIVANSDTDPAKEIANVEDMISRDVDAIVLNTVSVDALAGGIERAAAAGVPLYLVAVVPEDLTDILGATVVDLGGVGATAAGWIGEDAGDADVTVGVIAGAPGAASDYVVGGFTGALPATVEVVANQPGMFNRAKAQEVAENMIQADPDLDYAFVLNEDMAFGARAAFDAAGRADLQIVTLNGTEPGLQAVEDGQFSATVSDSAFQLGAESLGHTIALLADPNGEKIFQKPTTLITKDNIADATPFCG
ncbi:sugar ABC transporter substrate-binding protein [Microbacterium sp. Root61]|uniref:sugar ABC transporter substrate-binding protein n=1 Tax=Microbacterium sp. Root61 TaxID=1736570 RepID=UPI0006FC028C|nr:sugar ABC transporter substrate-binding protein [Microbacterium sp. Root61]KRA24585.1 sugar ABC transporter substrate-binding protein [Microbacterium sp. Root61]